ncbi:MAG: type II toxin-antitoxin system VapC family toxin [Gemmatimonadetes bacterium]|nr:type II toxin-antitoxin system VapC family toxin [Gemmatimonadota bacterium]
MSGPFVVDNSVVMAWCFEDEAGKYADAVLERLTVAEAMVPAIWPLEVGNVLLVAERRRRLRRADSERFIALLRQLPIVVEPEDARRALGDVMALARDVGLSTYDASYLNVALRHGLPIATMDRDLRKAARRCHVAVV